MRENDLHNLVKTAFAAGQQSFLSRLAPENGLINKTQAEKFVRSLGFKGSDLVKWENLGWLNPEKTGDEKTCRVLYSVNELFECMTTIRTAIVTNQ